METDKIVILAIIGVMLVAILIYTHYVSSGYSDDEKKDQDTDKKNDKQ